MTTPSKYYQDTCPICYVPFSTTTPYILDCQHVFCESCIMQFLSTDQCPSCLAPIIKHKVRKTRMEILLEEFEEKRNFLDPTSYTYEDELIDSFTAQEWIVERYRNT